MASLRLLSTDFDGTLVDHPSDGRCAPELADALLRARNAGALWAVNTGRSLDHAREGLEVFGAPFEPDFLLTLEREIFEPDGRGGWRDLGDWNRICRERHAALFHESEGVLDRLADAFAGFPDTTLIEEDGTLVGLVTADEHVMDRVAREVETVRGEFPELGYQRNTIYLRFCHKAYDKGAALAHLSRMREVDPGEIFAAGDHFNDLPMLELRVAAHLACPANAIPAVATAVASSGGYIAAERAGAGIAAALHHFLDKKNAGDAHFAAAGV